MGIVSSKWKTISCYGLETSSPQCSALLMFMKSSGWISFWCFFFCLLLRNWCSQSGCFVSVELVPNFVCTAFLKAEALPLFLKKNQVEEGK